MSTYVVEHTDAQGRVSFYRGRQDWCTKVERAKFFIRKSDAEYRAKNSFMGSLRVREVEVSVKLKEEIL